MSAPEQRQERLHLLALTPDMRAHLLAASALGDVSEQAYADMKALATGPEIALLVSPHDQIVIMRQVEVVREPLVVLD